MVSEPTFAVDSAKNEKKLLDLTTFHSQETCECFTAAPHVGSVLMDQQTEGIRTFPMAGVSKQQSWGTMSR